MFNADFMSTVEWAFRILVVLALVGAGSLAYGVYAWLT